MNEHHDDILDELEEMEQRNKRRHQQRELMMAMAAGAAAAAIAAVQMLDDDDEDAEAYEGAVLDHRCLPRAKRKVYDHTTTQACIQRDYTGPEPLFEGKQFEVMFRISKFRFERLMQDIGQLDHFFYNDKMDAIGNIGVSFEAKLMLPLKTMAYGVPPHCFCDYFQMSSTMARECCIMFDKTIRDLYQVEYLRYPTANDLVSITKLHKAVHQFDGMLGSLDCMHTYWKNCPVAWQGSYRGKEKRPTIVLEAMADYHMWFWHAAYGYAGTMNDLSILALSPFLEQLVNGMFDALEEEALVCPYNIGQHEFNKLYILLTEFTRDTHALCTV